jgi:hypothetical protein
MNVILMYLMKNSFIENAVGKKEIYSRLINQRKGQK